MTQLQNVHHFIFIKAGWVVHVSRSEIGLQFKKFGNHCFRLFFPFFFLFTKFILPAHSENKPSQWDVT